MQSPSGIAAERLRSLKQRGAGFAGALNAGPELNRKYPDQLVIGANATVPSTPHNDTFHAALAEMAEELRRTILSLANGERLEFVLQRVGNSEIVFGVWPDPGQTGGFGFHLIKGRGRLAALSGAKLPDGVTTTAIPCVGLEQAIAAEQVWGAPDPDQNPLKAARQKKGKKASRSPKKSSSRAASSLPKRARRAHH